MKEIFGKKVYTTLAERIAPEHTALLVVDVQNDFCAENGMIHRIFGDIRLATEMIPRLRKLVTSARNAGASVVFIKNCCSPDGSYHSPADLARRLDTYGESENILITLEGSWGEAVVDGLQVEKTDLVIRKYRPDAFTGTSLAQALRSNAVESVIVTGTATFACVESTARRALMEDFYVTVVEDCVATSDVTIHNASLNIMRSFFGKHGVCRSEDIIAIWEQ